MYVGGASTEVTKEQQARRGTTTSHALSTWQLGGAARCGIAAAAAEVPAFSPASVPAEELRLRALRVQLRHAMCGSKVLPTRDDALRQASHFEGLLVQELFLNVM